MNLFEEVLTVSQIRRHGAVYDSRQVRRRRLFVERRSGDCAACARHRLELRAHLPTESTPGEAQSADGQ